MTGEREREREGDARIMRARDGPGRNKNHSRPQTRGRRPRHHRRCQCAFQRRKRDLSAIDTRHLRVSTMHLLVNKFAPGCSLVASTSRRPGKTGNPLIGKRSAARRGAARRAARLSSRPPKCSVICYLHIIRARCVLRAVIRADRLQLTSAIDYAFFLLFLLFFDRRVVHVPPFAGNAAAGRARDRDRSKNDRLIRPAFLSLNCFT